VFSSDQFPKHLDDRGRRRRWQEFIEERYGSFDMTFAADRHFSARIELLGLGPTLIHRFEAPLVRSRRSARDIARDGNGDCMVALNCGRRPVMQRQLGREVEVGPQSLFLLSNAEPAEMLSPGGVRCLSVYVPRAQLVERVRNAEDLIARGIRADPSLICYLRRYLHHLIAAEDEIGHPLVAGHVGTTLLELVAATLESGRDGILRRKPGLRGAHLLEIMAAIKSRFDNPAFSPRQLASELRLTPRYVQDLLHEAGTSFTERVLELRLQKARSMLADRRCDRLRVSEIAYASGFNEVSYFNRCFRRRFGATPTHFRHGHKRPG
jgi:AraC-like DNA-binding protein